MSIAIVNGDVVEIGADDKAAFDSFRIEISERARVASIKAAAAELIDAIAPPYKQQNIAALRIDLLTKRMAGESISDDDLAQEQAANVMSSRIAAIRAASKAAVAQGVSIDDVKWPDEQAERSV